MLPSSPLLHEWLLSRAEHRPEAPAVATPALRLTYGDLAERVLGLAAHLAAAGVKRGDRVLVALANTPATVAASLAVHVLGGTAVEVNREWGPEVQGPILARTGARHAFVQGRDAAAWGKVAAGGALDRLWVVHGGPLPPKLATALGEARWTAILEDGRVDPAVGAAPAVAPVRPDPTTPALVLYTSGSTGQPRGVVQTFKNIDANSRSIVQYLGLGADDRALLVLPLYYCYGRSVLQTHLLAGGSLFLDHRFTFPRVVLEALGSEGCTGFAGVPMTFEIIRRQVDVSTLSLPRLRYLTQAGGAMAPETVDWVRQAFAPARLFVMYGQTEATARLSYLPPERGVEKRGSMGIPIPGVELRVVDDAARELPRGETGHLVARGDNVTLGYLGEPEETAAILHDGWLWTGDLASQDGDGFFHHRGRSKEILKIGGHRVSPIEIEHVVAEHPDVAEAAVVGRPDPLKGEVPVAFVVPRAGCTLDPAALAAFCRARMPAYRVPLAFTAVPALPRNEAGKLLRARLAAEAGAAGAGR
jgi:acyl-CoA synthetase (AMP-forming)/AMP-acid ligase II